MSVSNTRIDGSHAASPVLSMGQVFRFWLPLAASWLLMSTETPIVTAVAARMGDPKSQLAGFGVAYSLVLMVESPIISMLTAGNALARDGAPLRLVRRFMLGLGLGLTVVMLLLDLTPLFDLIVLRVIGVPHEVAAVARSTMLAMIPWPAAIAYRRFHQGVMIRHGYTRLMAFALPALRWAVLLPVLAAIQSWLRGIHVNAKSTAVIAWATAINLAGLLPVLWAGVVLGWMPGASLAAMALTISQCLESAWLWRGAPRQDAPRHVIAVRTGVGCTLRMIPHPRVPQ